MKNKLMQTTTMIMKILMKNQLNQPKRKVGKIEDNEYL